MVPAQWQMQKIATPASLRGLSVVSNKIVWASGTGGTFVKTTDGGQTWRTGQVAGAEKADFRDVAAFSGKIAYLLSIGTGESSRIYKTTDGGDNWQLQFQNTEPTAFFDALAFWDEKHGLAMSDPVRGRFWLLSTDDGGAHWTPVAPAGIPEAVTGEGGFAASGTCLITNGRRDAWLVSGGTAATARAYHSTDRGRTWRVMATPLASGTAGAGIFSIAFKDAQHGVMAGGDYQNPAQSAKTAAFTRDGGQTWQLATRLPGGYRSGVAWSRDGRTLAAVGTSGTDFSQDGGQTWTTGDAENFNAVAYAPNGTLWAAGPDGRLAKRPK